MESKETDQIKEIEIKWRIGVFCGSRINQKPVYRESTETLGKTMVERKYGLVYGGGTVGIMGVLANTINDGGGEVLGFIPSALAPRELSGSCIGKTMVVKDMHVRKLSMYNHANAFIALPGGFGTFEELLEVITWQQLGIHRKPIGILNVDGYYTPLLAMIKNGVDEGFIDGDFASKLLVISSDPIDLLNKLEKHEPPEAKIKWIDISDT